MLSYPTAYRKMYGTALYNFVRKKVSLAKKNLGMNVLRKGQDVTGQI